MSLEYVEPTARQEAPVGRSRNRSRFSPSMMSAVSPTPDFMWCSSPSCQKTASPATIGSSTPSAPLTSPEPSRTARICGKVAGCRRSRPPGATRKIAAWMSDPSKMDGVSGATVHTIEQITVRHERHLRGEAEPFHEHLLAALAGTASISGAGPARSESAERACSSLMGVFRFARAAEPRAYAVAASAGM